MGYLTEADDFFYDLDSTATPAHGTQPLQTRVRLPGEIPEWSKGADCKSVGYAFEGSNPSLPTSLLLFERKKAFSFLR